MKWSGGRQGGGYEKIKILESEFFKFDFYLLKIPQGTDVKPHRDPVPAPYKHHRINIRLSGDAVHRTAEWESEFFTKFRPDEEVHWVPVVGKTSYFISIGWLK